MFRSWLHEVNQFGRLVGIVVLPFPFQDYRKQRQAEAARQGSTNSTSKIDSMARILFPLSFGLFNVIYWYSYFSAHPPFDWEDHMLKGEYLVVVRA